MSAKTRTRQLVADDEDFFKETIEPEKEDDFDYKDILMRKKKFTKSQTPIEEKSISTRLVRKPIAAKPQARGSSSEESSGEKERNECKNKIVTSMFAFKRNSNNSTNSSINLSQNIPFKINNSANKKSTLEKLSKTKDLDKLYAISDDDMSENETNSKSYASFLKESDYHENKIKEFTKQMAESKLAEKKAKWLNLDDFKSDEDEDNDEKIEQSVQDLKKKTPPSSNIDANQKKRINGSNEVNNNYTSEAGMSSSDDIIEVNDTPKKREFNRKTIERDDKIEARLEKVK